MQAGAGVYIRLKHRFGPRLTEWLIAAQTALFGLVLLLPADIFSGEAWLVFRQIKLSQGGMGLLMLFLGLARLAGLVINGTRPKVTPWIRVISASIGFMIFTGLSFGFALSGHVSTWIAIYPMIAMVELVNLYRAIFDASENGRRT